LQPFVRIYWIGVADKWGKAELDGDSLYRQKYGVSCVFSSLPFVTLPADPVNYLLERAVVILDGAEVGTGSRT
jgi:hypothetical protein